jgi:hypothetical protein
LLFLVLFCPNLSNYMAAIIDITSCDNILHIELFMKWMSFFGMDFLLGSYAVQYNLQKWILKCEWHWSQYIKTIKYLSYCDTENRQCTLPYYAEEYQWAYCHLTFPKQDCNLLCASSSRITALYHTLIALWYRKKDTFCTVFV